MDNQNKACCIDCEFFSDTTNKCTNDNGLLKDIIQSKSLAEAQHNCSAYKEAHYVLTPKGCLSLAFNKANVCVTQEKFDIIWDDFTKSMKNAGYISE